MLRLVNNLLDLSQLASSHVTLEPEATALSILAARCVALVEGDARKKNLAIEIHDSCKPGLMVLVDPLRLQQILLNLLSNAVKFTAEGTISLSIVSKPIVEKDGNKLDIAFRVADTGIGISPEQRIKIYSRYARGDASASKKVQGAGLGLAITRELVELMGGSISVESEQGKGSIFTVYLVLNICP